MPGHTVQLWFASMSPKVWCRSTNWATQCYFVQIPLSPVTALWWLGGTFWCYSSPCRQQHIGGVLLIGSLMPFGAFPPLVSNRALVARGILVFFFTCPHTTLQIVWLGPLCCFFLAFWCFSPTCHHKNFSDLVLFSDFTSKHADTPFYKVRGVTDHSYTKVTPLSNYILGIAMFKSP